MTLLRRLDLGAQAAEAPAPGVEGNRRLTAALGAVLLVLLAVEGGTIPFLGQLEVVHVVVGLVLIPIVLLKLGTTLYRFARYYTADGDYRRAGPPHPVMRMAGPFVVVTTVALFASGVTLAIVGRHSQIVYGVHKASFIAWFAAMTVHVLGHVWSLPSVAARDWSAAQRMPDSRVRQLALVGIAVAGVAVAAVVYPMLPAWGSAGGPRPAQLTRHGRIGNAFGGEPKSARFSGSATFVSHRRPSVSRVRVCSVGRNLRRFVATRYRGTLSPDAGAPLTAMFDTGGFALERGSALLVIRSYLR